MTFGFFLTLAGFILLDAGWKGVTPAAVLQGVTEGHKGAGGVIAETGRDVLASLSGSSGGTTAPSPTGKGGGAGVKKAPKKLERDLAKNHPELKPGIRAVATAVLVAFPGLEITSTTGGTHVSDSRHYEGRAVDIGGSTDEMNKAAKWIARTIGHMLDEGIHNPGLSYSEGGKVPSSFWGAETWAAHADHIHLAV